MGCLNSGQGFSHWFGNIHLSGLCNRSCYFCIGQHMMALDKQHNLHKWPLDGLEEFLLSCYEHGVKEINLTGTNTDPALYRHQPELVNHLRSKIPGVVIGIRTNGSMIQKEPKYWQLYDKASISIPSFNLETYRSMMGSGEPPVLIDVMRHEKREIKLNVVLSPKSVQDLAYTLHYARFCNIKKVNLREPYGQPHVGDPLEKWGHLPKPTKTYGMTTYDYYGMKVTYWDVHYCEVESVNLYANGRVSVDYPITRGHDETGTVKDQSQWGDKHERKFKQWVS